MNMTQVLTWLLGPGLASGLSYVLDQNAGWRNWKPVPLFGFSPKMIVVNLASGAIGLATYGLATSRPDLVDTADPIVQVWFPLLAPIVAQIWHAFINPRLTGVKTKIEASIETGTASAEVTVTPDSGTSSPGQGGLGG